MYFCVNVRRKKSETFSFSSCLPLLFSLSAFFFLYLSQKYDTLAIAPIDNGKMCCRGELAGWRGGDKGLRMCMTFFRTFLEHNVINEWLKHTQQQRAAEKNGSEGIKWVSTQFYYCRDSPGPKFYSHFIDNFHLAAPTAPDCPMCEAAPHERTMKNKFVGT